METNNATPLYKNGDEELGDEYYIWGAEHIPEHLVKYWYQRYNLFSKYDEGIMLDEESWFSVTPEKVAEYQAQRLACDTIIDGFCGAGGNAIQFAKTCKKVIAIDIDPTKLRCARNNARIYGVEDKIEFVLGDVLEVLKGRTADTIFLSPPWGGPEYLQADAYDIHTMLPIDATTLFETARAVTPNVCMFMPRNVISQQLADLAGPGGVCEVEEEFLNGRSKAIVAYYGGLVGDGVAEEEEEVEVEEE
ncbi:RNA cap guanine-N2 methyltransferase-domain-containing protein [Fimicolochytrium jonesii]|uniref:RNA cap guanine-N2 methyltransferase-domain-containing protein n=1 Tax=Fimicolochytrium jonesii TaxID=1396493 RepID=UPI0022FEEB76|nr:RNA cap guanine-N2 methyltransferase-domain-containing protein [Fimicolochytrium jonesii]KAI8819926.1 RNA cap guanine-N2 methyltransferase-domain-containing protein [Fimicolochytrium jonesii]